MGSPPTERDHRPDETQVDVTLSRGYWMGKFEVTQGQWRRAIGAIPGVLNAGAGDNFPVYGINYPEVVKFCRKLTEQARAAGELPAGWAFRPPTEAEWEYACRAGSTTAFSCGNKLTTANATFGKPYDGTPTGVPGSAATRVGNHAANAWGLHDMHGNEWEWCRDWYHARLPGGVDPDLSTVQVRGTATAPTHACGAAEPGSRPPTTAARARRLRYEPPRRSDHIGFRVSLSCAADD